MYVITNNFNESAYEAQLFISHPPSLTYISHIAENKRQTCIRTNNTLVVCSIGNPFKKGDVAKIILRFNPEGLEDYESHLKFVVFANSTSEEKKPQGPLELFTNVIRRAEVGLTGAVRPEQVFYGGEVKGEYAMEYRDDIGSRVLHSYQVTNKGPWSVSSLVVSIEWPFQVGNDKPQGKWLLYLDEKPIVESLVNYSSPMASLVLTDSSQLTALKSYQTKLSLDSWECHLPDNEVNPLGLPQRPGLAEPPLEALMTQPSNHTRTKRDTEMNCLLGTAKCIKFNCTLFNLKKDHSATIKIQARLWNSTLVEDYPKVNQVNITSRAKIHLPESLNIRQTNTQDDEAYVVTTAFPDLIDQQEPEAVPIWIIVVAVVAGLLLLILLTLVLWKLGFFKRRRPDPTLSGNLEKSHREDNGDYSS
uniref:Integrin alpha-2 domain-containing protein n=1 Tax=Timema douglasi TaxID=61478 RepID=A0A7R8VVF1_TIMDO|nr:unnamed protein product [Timema douglasi]